MNRKIKLLLSIAMTAVLTCAVFAGCGGKSPSSDKILRFGTSSIEGKFNPILSDKVYDTYVVDMVFEKLVTYNAEGEYIPKICSYEISDDKLTYTFTLKNGIKFSDGTPMTTADVYFTYATIAHPDYDGPRGTSVDKFVGYEAYHSGSTDVFEGIKIIDDKKISFTFTPGNESPANIINFDYGIMPVHYYQFTDYKEFLALADKPFGSGRLVMDAYEPAQYVQLSRNENYWDPANALKFGGVLISNIPDESLLGAMQTDQIDLCQPSASKENVEAFTALSGVTPRTFIGNGYTYMQFNTTRDTLSDVRVRQALMYALDRKSFIKVQYGEELASVGMAPFAPSSWAFPKGKGDLNPYDFDMAKAEQLMADAGWVKNANGILEKNGKTMTVSWLVYQDSPWPGTLSGMAADSWKQLGVDLKIELMDFVTVAARVQEPEPADKDFDIYTMGFSLDADPDPTGALFDYDAYVAGGFNSSGYYNERAQELIKLGRSEFDQKKRMEYYNEFAKIMNEEIPTVIIAYRNELWAVNDRVKGMSNGTYADWVKVLPDVTID